jgi:tRNA nucleotidyltransferase/poly(A) polymerase
MEKLRIPNHSIPENVKKLCKILEQNGFEAFIVGGAVRDLILSKMVSDWDIATNAKPEQVRSLFKRTILQESNMER